MKKAIVTLFVFFSVATSVLAQSLTPEEARAIAKDAYVYGFPLVDSYRVQYSYFVDRSSPEYKGPWNRIVNTFNFAYIGSRTTGNDGGSFLIAGPNWKGETPKGVTKVIRSETEFVLALYHSALQPGRYRQREEGAGGL